MTYAVRWQAEVAIHTACKLAYMGGTEQQQTIRITFSVYLKYVLMLKTTKNGPQNYTPHTAGPLCYELELQGPRVWEEYERRCLNLPGRLT